MISPKQRKILAFPYTNYDALICDGAIRSGKTAIMTIAFIDDAMKRYNGQRFGICGKTVDSAIKNIIVPYISTAYAKNKYRLQWKRSDKVLIVTKGRKTNVFEVFGGRDESSFALIQGRTLAGVLIDEVALMPRSFVEQACARCSVDGSKLWFNCNPESPHHWFYLEWIKEARSKNALHLHFDLEDNPSLSEDIIKRYKNSYKGVFYQRYVLGLWVVAEGLIYPNFDAHKHVCGGDTDVFGRYFISVDYGTLNPCSMGLWCVSGGIAYRIDEYYYSGRDKQNLLTDEDYCDALEKLAGNRPIERIIVDPSAASFKAAIKRRGKYSIRDAENSVLDGIRVTSSLLQSGRLLFSDKCKDSIREFGEYCWDMEATEDKPIKENDHAMDDIRYFCATVLCRELRWTNWREKF